MPEFCVLATCSMFTGTINTTNGLGANTPNAPAILCVFHSKGLSADHTLILHLN